MADHIHLFKPGATVTCVAGADITGQRLVEITGDRTVELATPGAAAVFGAAAQDTPEGSDVLVLRGGVQQLIAAAPIPAGTRVQAAADGKVTAAAAGDSGIGLAITSAAAANDTAQIALD